MSLLFALALALACGGTHEAEGPPTPELVAWMPVGPELPRLCLSPVPQGEHLSRGEQQALAAARARLAAGQDPGPLEGLPLHPATEVLRAGQAVREGRDEEARERFRDLANLWTEDPCVQQAAAFTSFRAGAFLYAAPYLKAAATAWPGEPEVGLLEAIVAVLVQGDPEAGLAPLRRVVAARPDHVVARTWLGRVLSRRGAHDEALPHLLAARAAGLDVGADLARTAYVLGDLGTYLAVAGTSPPLPRDLRAEPDPVAAYRALLGIPAEGPLWVDLRTSQGTLSCELHWREAPLTVGAFLGLATGTSTWTDPVTGAPRTGPLYPGTILHRVIPGFMVQGGDPTGTGTGGPGYRFADEIDPDLRFDRPGRLAMANAGPGTNGSQWFVTEVPTPHLDGRHTIFGTCTDASVEVVKAIGRLPRGEGDKPLVDVVLEGIEVR